MMIIIGKNGQLAKKCGELLEGQNFLMLGRNEIDITSDNLTQTLDKLQPNAIINASAYTAVDKAETEKALADKINHVAVKRLSDYCLVKNIHFVHVSTDYVFQGDKGSPYLPSDDYAPINAYGESKMLGEKAIMYNNPSNQCILRTSWVYSEYGGNFVSAMLNLMEHKETLGVIYDQIGTPTSVDTLAKACIEASQQNVEGIHHVTDHGVASWYDFAKCIQKMAFKENMISKMIPVNPIASKEYPTPAKRPHYSVLSKQSLKEALPNLQLPYWQDALGSVLLKIKTISR